LLPRAELLAGVDGIRPDLIEAYASAIVAEIVADDSEFAQREGAEAVREALDDVLTYKERRAAWARAQELWPGLRKAWWKGLMLPTLSLIALLIAIALVGLVLLAVYVLIRGAASVVWKR
jgi:hypothetical protein